MGELLFLGLGLHDDRDLSMRALEAARSCDRLFLEIYTSILPGLDLERLESAVGHEVHRLGRTEVEVAEEILSAATTGRVGLFVPGDPMTATTHVDLRLRAIKRGIRTRLFHGPSILTAAAGLLGLHIYKFGPAVSIPRPQPSYRPTSPYEKLAVNLKRGQHTLALLDTGDGERPLTAAEAFEYLLSLEGEFRERVTTRESLACVVARAGSEEPVVAAATVGTLTHHDFGPPPHVLVFPSELHFTEIEALRALAGFEAPAP